jgi:phosphoadenosine phosphosulfate reductase
MGDAVLAHLASKVAPGIDVVFLDTGYHFVETIGTRDAVAAHPAGQPDHDHAGAERRRAGRGVRQGPLQDRPRPVLQAAQGAAAGRLPRRYDAWATGLRRAETHNRVIAPVIGWDAKKGKVKVSPLARWSDEQVERYIAENGVLVNPLVYDGYPSIGCWPCTRRVAPGEDPRSGRWAGTNKTECGIHS